MHIDIISFLYLMGFFWASTNRQVVFSSHAAGTANPMIYIKDFIEAHCDTLDTFSDKIPIDFSGVMSFTSTYLSLF